MQGKMSFNQNFRPLLKKCFGFMIIKTELASNYISQEIWMKQNCVLATAL